MTDTNTAPWDDLEALTDEQLATLLPGDEPMIADGADNHIEVEPLPEPDVDEPAIVMPAMASSVIRTITPMIVGWVVAGLTGLGVIIGRWLGVDLGVPEGLTTWLEGTVPVVLGAVYYIAARALEKHWPNVPWLGSKRQPVYTEPSVVADERSLATPAAFATLASSVAIDGRVLIHNRRGCTCQRDTLPHIEAELRAMGVIKKDLAGLITQQGYNGTAVSASAGTHAGGGVWDVPAWLVDTDAKRAVWFKWGWIPFYRLPSDAPRSRWPAHGHLVVAGCSHRPASAKAQEVAARRGRNALVNNGPFRGKLPSRFVTWREALDHLTAPVAKPTTATKVTVNGVLDTTTVKALQTALRNRYHASGPNGKPVYIDGKLGTQTYGALQRVLQHRMPKTWAKLPITGQFSSIWIKRLQWYVGTKVDGVWGPVTTRKLQEKLLKGF